MIRAYYGQLINRVWGGRVLPYADQRSDYVIPKKYLAKAKSHLHVSTSPYLKSISSLNKNHSDLKLGIHLKPQLCLPHLTSAFQFSNGSLAATLLDAEINIIVHDPTLGSTTLDVVDIGLRNIEKERAKNFRVWHHNGPITRK